MEEIIIVFGVGLVIGILVIIGLWSTYYSALKAYQDSLEALKKDPHNPSLKENALSLGRKWLNAAATLRSSGFTNAPVVEEATLLNDINAATARAGSEVTIKELPVAKAIQATIAERLSQLDTLREKRLITEQEYASRREQILREL